MNSKDLQIFHDALLSLSMLLGKEEERHKQQCEPAIEPAFQSDMVCVATHGALKFYVNRGSIEKSQSDASDVNTEKEQLMKYCTKRADGRWQASKTIDGKRVFVYGKTQAEAIEKLRKLSGRKQNVKQESFHKFALWWAETFKKGRVTEKTYTGYVAVINSHLKITTPINKVTSFQLQETLNKLATSRMRVEVFQLMRQICKKAYELEYIKKDVSQFLDKGKVEKPERRALTLDEQQRLMSQLTGDMFSRRVMFYLCTGARPSEIATVRKDELRPGWLKINGTKTKGALGENIRTSERDVERRIARVLQVRRKKVPNAPSTRVFESRDNL